MSAGSRERFSQDAAEARWLPGHAGALVGFGTVRHERLRPVAHAFAYPSCFLMLPMRRMRRDGPGALPRNRFAVLGFEDRDHGDGRADSLAWLEELLQREGVPDADGEIWLQTFPRMLGQTFKPVSFWWCERADGTLAALVAEVNNTFGERHCYLLQGPQLQDGRELRARKVFHVSPFCRVEGEYRFRFMRTDAGTGRPARTVMRVELHDERGPLLLTSIGGTLEPYTDRAARRALLRLPLAGAGVLARIHWQALRLWLKRVPFHPRPAPLAAPVTGALPQAARRSAPPMRPIR